MFPKKAFAFFGTGKGGVWGGSSAPDGKMEVKM